MNTLLVCDAGPLIIMAKLGVLNQWFGALLFQTAVVDAVVAELRRGPFEFGEETEIEKFLSNSCVVSSPEFKPSSECLSLQDQASLVYAEAQPGCVLLADDRLLRRAAGQAGVRVIGFPGILMLLTRNGMISVNEALKMLDDAIEMYQYRISISLYQGLQKKLEELRN